MRTCADWLHAVIPWNDSVKSFARIREGLVVHMLYDAATQYLTRLNPSDYPYPNGSVPKPILAVRTAARSSAVSAVF
jgi:hypothetical protein